MLPGTHMLAIVAVLYAVYFIERSTFVGSAWSFSFFIPATTANDLRLRRIFYPRFYPLHLFSYLNSWERDMVLDWGLNPGPPTLEASTIPLGYRGGGVCSVWNGPHTSSKHFWGFWRYITRGLIWHLRQSSTWPSFFLVWLWNYARILSWNQPVLSNKGKVSCSKKQRGPLMGL